ncbi:hypothetical protein [Amycolatopsis thermalba]|uniref:hypothetical protein n=1 Tax=Amycolatopsis thermalba TaxID=944492 RepID=UPI0013BE9B20|nr:hypothetical protein [Amycolatopsis thermalba]
MIRYTSVEDFYDRLAVAHDQQAQDGTEHAVTRQGAQARAEHYREIADQARRSRRGGER